MQCRKSQLDFSLHSWFSFASLGVMKIYLICMQVGKKHVVVMQPVLLRRTKTSTIDGEPVVKLPPREQQLVCKAFSASEQRFYNQVQQESMQKLKVWILVAIDCGSQLVQSGTSPLQLALNHLWSCTDTWCSRS
jgi:hypothetical protein